jgi:tetrahydromethanopterin S-methyltransferase subunit G
MQALTDKQHFDAIETKVDKLDRRVDKLDTRIDNLEKKVDDGFGALYRLIIQSFAGLGATMILGFAALFLQSHL